MRLKKILIIIGMIIAILSVVLFFLLGEFWFFPILFIIPYCFSRSRFRVENYEEPSNNDYNQDEARGNSGETTPFVDLGVEMTGNKENRCPKCHTLIEEENIRYCPNCGHKLVK
jgi:hypothetical protein